MTGGLATRMDQEIERRLAAGLRCSRRNPLSAGVVSRGNSRPAERSNQLPFDLLPGDRHGERCHGLVLRRLRRLYSASFRSVDAIETWQSGVETRYFPDGVCWSYPPDGYRNAQRLSFESFRC